MTSMPMAAAIDADTRLVFIANPNNPTGTFFPAREIEAFLAAGAAQRGGRAGRGLQRIPGAEAAVRIGRLGAQVPDLIVSRTFSKAYGLAGLRVGFAIAEPAVTDLMNRVRQPFNVNSLAQAAAIAALNDKEFLREGRGNNARRLQQLRRLRTTRARLRAVLRQFRAGAGRRRRRRRRAR